MVLKPKYLNTKKLAEVRTELKKAIVINTFSKCFV